MALINETVLFDGSSLPTAQGWTNTLTTGTPTNESVGGEWHVKSTGTVDRLKYEDPKVGSYNLSSRGFSCEFKMRMIITGSNGPQWNLFFGDSTNGLRFLIIYPALGIQLRWGTNIATAASSATIDISQDHVYRCTVRNNIGTLYIDDVLQCTVANDNNPFATNKVEIDWRQQLGTTLETYVDYIKLKDSFGPVHVGAPTHF